MHNISVETLDISDVKTIDYIASDLASRDPWLRLCVSKKALYEYILGASARKEACLYFKDGVLVSIVVTKERWLKGRYIELFSVLKEFCGNGYGGRIIEDIINKARMNNENLWVCCSGFNSGALRFYARHGFYVIGDIDGLIKKGESEILLRLPNIN